MILRLIDIGITMRRLLAMLVGEVNFDEPSKLLRLDTNPRQTRSVPIFWQTRSGALAHYLPTRAALSPQPRPVFVAWRHRPRGSILKDWPTVTTVYLLMPWSTASSGRLSKRNVKSYLCSCGLNNLWFIRVALVKFHLQEPPSVLVVSRGRMNWPCQPAPRSSPQTLP